MAIIAVPSLFVGPFPLDFEFLGEGIPQLSLLPLPTTPHHRHPYGLFSDVSVN